MSALPIDKDIELRMFQIADRRLRIADADFVHTFIGCPYSRETGLI